MVFPYLVLPCINIGVHILDVLLINYLCVAFNFCFRLIHPSLSLALGSTQ